LIIARYLSVSETLERYLAIRNQTFLINFLERRRRQIERGGVPKKGVAKSKKIKKKLETPKGENASCRDFLVKNVCC